MFAKEIVCAPVICHNYSACWDSSLMQRIEWEVRACKMFVKTLYTRKLSGGLLFLTFTNILRYSQIFEYLKDNEMFQKAKCKKIINYCVEALKICIDKYCEKFKSYSIIRMIQQNFPHPWIVSGRPLADIDKSSHQLPSWICCFETHARCIEILW